MDADMDEYDEYAEDGCGDYDDNAYMDEDYGYNLGYERTKSI